FEPTRRRKILHRLLLFLGELFRNVDLNFDDQVTRAVVFLDAVRLRAKTFAVRRTRRDADRELLSLECVDADLRAERRLRDVDFHRRDEIETFATEETVGLHLERDQEVARGTVAHATSALPLETNLRSRVDSRGNRDVHLLPHAEFAGAVTRRTALARHRAFAEAHRTRTLDGKAALAERDRSATLTLGARLDLRARSRTGAVAGCAFLRHLELDRHLAALRRSAEWNR